MGTPPCSGRRRCTSAACLCSGCSPACSEPTPNPDPPRRARALLPQLSQPRAQCHVADKALCGADRGELATFPHTPAHVHTQVLVTQKTFAHLWQVNLKKKFGPTAQHIGSYFPSHRLKLAPPAFEVQSLNHWTTRKVPTHSKLNKGHADTGRCWISGQSQSAIRPNRRS